MIKTNANVSILKQRPNSKMNNRDKLELGDGTLRQRRNLLTITLSLMAIKLGDISLAKNIKILGTSAQIGNPELFIPALFVTQFYLTWRFLQYIWSDDAYGHLDRQLSNYRKEMYRSWFHKQIMKNLPKGVSVLSKSPKHEDLARSHPKRFDFEVEYIEGEQNLKCAMSFPNKTLFWGKAGIWIKHIVRAMPARTGLSCFL
jgi:hypothetical protein